MILLLRLLLAQLLGDFFLQPDAWVAHKELRKWQSGYLYLQAALHGALAWLACWNRGSWKAALIIAVTHLLVDTLLSFCIAIAAGLLAVQITHGLR